MKKVAAILIIIIAISIQAVTSYNLLTDHNDLQNQHTILTKDYQDLQTKYDSLQSDNKKLIERLDTNSSYDRATRELLTKLK